MVKYNTNMPSAPDPFTSPSDWHIVPSTQAAVQGYIVFLPTWEVVLTRPTGSQQSPLNRSEGFLFQGGAASVWVLTVGGGLLGVIVGVAVLVSVSERMRRGLFGV